MLKYLSSFAALLGRLTEEKLIGRLPQVKELKRQNLGLEDHLRQLSNKAIEQTSALSDMESQLADFVRIKSQLESENSSHKQNISHYLGENASLKTELRILQERNFSLNEIEKSRLREESTIQSLKDALERFEMKESNKPIVNIGGDGEDFVLASLQAAFPNNTGIVKNKEKHSGDVLFRVENTNKFIMFEVKNYQKSSGAISASGKEMEKFFSDLNNNSSSVEIGGAVLVSLNGPVDVRQETMKPNFDRTSGKPYLFVDSMRDQFPDPSCLMKVVVHLMTYLIKNSEKLQDDKSFLLKLEEYQRCAGSILKTHRKLHLNNVTQSKNLTDLKLGIDDLNKALLFDNVNGDA